MRIDILTIFPGMFCGPFGESMVKRAVDRGLVEICLHDIREWATDRHRTVDDYPYGGGPGMVMKPEPLFAAVEGVTGAPVGPDGRALPRCPVILLTPQGRLFTQQVARDLAQLERFVLVCGHYEGVDERVREHLVTDELSIGDYVLTGGELAAMVIVDVVVRLLPGVLSVASTVEESHAQGLLEYPQYTRPASFRGWDVPEMLLSGNHGLIARWRRQQSLIRTLLRRPELLDSADLSGEDQRLLDEVRRSPPSEQAPGDES